MTDPGRPASPRTGVTWGEVLPLGVGALLIVAGVVLVLAVLWRGGGPSMPSAVAVASDASGVALATPSPLSTGTPSSTLAPTPTPQPTPRVVAETVADLTWRSVALLPGSADPAGQTVVVNDLAHGPHAY